MSVSSETETTKGGWGETVKVVIQALILALVVRTAIYQSFNIPSGSMKSTLLVGDYVFASKFAYGFSRYSLPGPLQDLPLHGRLFGAEPKRGDIVVFRKPGTDEDLIKRVIGLPGDHVQMRGGVLWINGAPVPKDPVDTFTDVAPFGRVVQIPRLRETLPGGKTYQVLDIDPNGPGDNTREYIVPAGHFFMMGDNRDDSLDSRFPEVGFIPFENLIARADVVFFSIEGEEAWRIWEWPSRVRWGRLFTGL